VFVPPTVNLAVPLSTIVAASFPPVSVLPEFEVENDADPKLLLS
jgi:hypothetical protein